MIKNRLVSLYHFSSIRHGRDAVCCGYRHGALRSFRLAAGTGRACSDSVVSQGVMMPIPWWKNSRGELFVFAQFIVFGLIALAPQTLAILPEWSCGFRNAGTFVGGVMLTSGFLLAAAGTFNLGRNLTPFICPKAGCVLLEQGAYRLVRHPIYSGLLQIGFGWGLWVHGWLTLCYSLILFIIFDLKSHREEKLLLSLFPGYTTYSLRVKRLIPFIY